MIRLVLDTNLLVSAILTPQGKPAAILKLALQGTFNLVVSHAMLEETHRVLQYPKLLKLMKRRKITLKEVNGFIDKMSKVATITPGKLNIKAIQDDPSDNMILVCAVEGEADFIISGDHHLTELKTFQGIKIVDPVTFLTIVQYNT
ncbi:MAG: putative toxin-antitoxin system toxin component, PIN family [Deltaproteobacteria bacterium]|nr:putative toxin-antitoxin system toxin component, PIN family [Deltaproteobacteria bacterium]